MTGDQWAGIRILLVDGNNLLHAVSGGVGAPALRGLLARLAAGIPAEIDATVVLDGMPDPGAPARTRVRRGLDVRHSGRGSADALIVQAVEAWPFSARDGVTVVTNDIELAVAVRRAGGRSQRVDWLEQRLGAGGRSGAPGTSIVGSRPRARVPTPRDAGASGGAGEPGDRTVRDEGPDREPWRAGRGATRKRGNPHRGR